MENVEEQQGSNVAPGVAWGRSRGQTAGPMEATGEGDFILSVVGSLQ